MLENGPVSASAAHGAQVCYSSCMRHLVIVLSLVLLACERNGTSVTAITVEDATYRIPWRHLSSISHEPHQFVRISARDRTFDLIYDSRTVAREDRAGRPIVFSINDGRKPGVEHYARGDLMVICRRAVNPEGGCGFKVLHRGAEWTVVFPGDQLPAADAICRRALEALNSYS